MQKSIIPHIIERHAEDAAFLWLLRDAAVKQPHYDLADLLDLEERLEANLDGLLVAGDAGWEIAFEQLKHQEPGEVFICGWLAARYLDGNHLDKIIEIALRDRDNYKALASALAWHPLKHTAPLIKSLLAANDANYYWLGIHVCALHRRDPGDALLRQFSLKPSNPAAAARALCACGELGRRDLLDQLIPFYNNNESELSFWALWSGCILGDRTALKGLKTHALAASKFSEKALALLVRLLSREKQDDFLRQLAGNPATEALALRAAGWSGNINWIPGLILRMDDDKLAPICGEAFSMLTGANLSYLDLDCDPPENFSAGPNEAPNEGNIELDTDQDLPWPDKDKVLQWWSGKRDQFDPSRRYLFGLAITHKGCMQTLRKGFQRQRRSAAIELGLLENRLFSVDAPAKQQLAQLDKLV